MPTKPYLKLSLIVIALFTLLLSGCFDLGSFKDDADYCNSFSKVNVYEGYKVASYDFEDFYSSKSVNDLESVLDYGCYQAISFQAKKDMLIDEFYLFLSGPKRERITMNLFIADNDISIKRDEDDNEEIEDLDTNLMVGFTSTFLSTEFNSISYNGDYRILENQYIIITFKENLVKNELENISFNFTNILIRGIF